MKNKTERILWGVGLFLVIATLFITSHISVPQTQTTESIPVKIIDPINRSADKEVRLKAPRYGNGDKRAIFDDENGTKILDFLITSHTHVNQTKEVGVGFPVTLSYEVNSTFPLENILGEVEFTDMETNERVNRDWEYVVKTNTSITQEECAQTQLQGNGTSICTRYTNKTYQVPTWKPLTNRNIPKGNTIIGIKVEVRAGDHIDGVFTFKGTDNKTIRIDRHAEWTASLNAGIKTYYNLSNALDFFKNYNLTENGGVTFTPGLIADGATPQVINTGQFLNTTESWGIDGDEVTLDIFVNATAPPTVDHGIMGTCNDASDVCYILDYDDGGGTPLVRFKRLRNLVADDIISQAYTLPINGSAYQYIVGTYNGTHSKLYINSTLVATSAAITGNGSGATSQSSILSNVQAPGRYFNGKVDEAGVWGRALSQSEIIQRYNNGAGTTPPASQEISLELLTPLNGANLVGNPVDFSLNVSIFPEGSLAIENVTLNTYYSNGSFVFTETNTSGIEGIYNFSSNFSDGNYLWNVMAFDNFTDSYESDNFTFSIESITEINQTYNQITQEGSTEDFLAFGSIAEDISIVEANFIYNGTESTGTITSIEGNSFFAEKNNFLIPQVTSDTNVSFYWSFLLSNDNIFNFSIQNQTIQEIDIDDCSAGTVPIFNLTIVDEELQTELPNTTLDVAINIYSIDRSQSVVNFSGSFTDNPQGICLNQNLTTEYLLDAIFKYSSVGYAIEYYNVFNAMINESNEIREITLYDLNESDSTEFRITFTGEDFLPVEDALVFINRQYIAENIFKTVELPKTDSKGQTIAHLVRNDVVYNIVVVSQGESFTFSNQLAFCDELETCEIALNALSAGSPIVYYNDELGIIFTEIPSYNASTQVISFSFVTDTGESKTLTMDVERRDIFGNTSICSSTLISSSGTLSCNVGTLSDTELLTTIKVNGVIALQTLIPLDNTTYGSLGALGAMVLSLVTVLIFSRSKSGVLIALLFSYGLAVSLGFIIGGLAGIGTAGIWMIVITVAAMWKVNKERFE